MRIKEYNSINDEQIAFLKQYVISESVQSLSVIFVLAVS